MTPFQKVLINFNRSFPQQYNQLALFLAQVPAKPTTQHYERFLSLLDKFGKLGCNSDSLALVSLLSTLGLQRTVTLWRKTRNEN